MKKDIPKAYEPKKYEDEIYEKWEKSGYFNPDNLKLNKNAKPFVVSMPPPNVTGNLHMGHAVMLAIEDILIRYHRMKSERALWVPGTDHAAIATQTKVEKLLKEEGTNRHKLGREKFLNRVEQYAQDSHDTIVNQIKKMGCSCDWDREAYTLDKIRTKAVRSVFKLMYDDGLVYRGERIVNWCPRCHSTLSDDEVEHKTQSGDFYTFKYSKDFPFAIATTRPETKLGDTAVAVHPDDKRYKKYIGKIYEIDFVGVPLKLKIIADKGIDREYGTGALGVTPAHSMVDWQMAEEHGLKSVKVINEDGKIHDSIGDYAGKNVLEARKLVINRLKEQGLLEKEETIENNISICYRCDTTIEPLPSLQWFINVNKKVPKYGKSIKKLSVDAVRTGVFGREKIKIVPERFEKNYFHWMDNLRDWCISRQIWYGHRVPVWYKTEVGSSKEAVHFKKSVLCKKLGLKNEKEFNKFSYDLEQESSWKDKNIQWISNQDGIIQLYIGYVDLLKKKGMFNDTWIEENRIRKPHREAEIYIGEKPPADIGWYQDPDTLDTWFSSGLWTFSTLANDSEQIKIENGKLVVDSEDFRKFHPTAVLETGYDILFFWVARMIIMTTYAVGDIPFKDVYLHGLIRDETGRKMSKSLGNVIDPLDMCEKYGTDATRLSLIIGTTPGNDMNLSEDKIAGYRNFVNKLWNISRYILQNYELQTTDYKVNKDTLTSADDWILKEMVILISRVTEDLNNYQFSQAGEKLREFTWNQFADWYLEASKFEKTEEKEKILTTILSDLLKLWHPFVPFVTEAIWKELGHKDLIMTSKWPDPNNYLNIKINHDIDSRSSFALAVLIIKAIRNTRAQYKTIKSSQKINAVIYAGEDKDLVESQAKLIKSLKTGIEELIVKDKGERPKNSIFITVSDVEIYLIVPNFNFEAEKKRINKEIKEQVARIKTLEKKLSNKAFIDKAPEEIVEQEREKLKLWQSELEKREERLKNLQ